MANTSGIMGNTTPIHSGEIAIIPPNDAICELAALLGRKAEFLRVAGRPAFLIRPDAPKGMPVPWVWYAPSFAGLLPDGSHAWMFSRFLENGVAVGGVDVGESCGAPSGRSTYTAFYELLRTAYGFSEKPCLLAQSRGALMLYNWAIENPNRVACIAGIFPLCNMRWFYDYRIVCSAYALSRLELEQQVDNLGPLGRLRPLAEAEVPILHIQGDHDGFVPIEHNSGAILSEYQALGGKMELIVVPGKGHEVAPEFLHNQDLVDFVIQHLVPAANGANPTM